MELTAPTRPGTGPLVEMFRRHPVGSAVGLAAADAVLLVLVAVLLRVVAPDLRGQQAALAVLTVLAVVFAGLVTWLGWWRRIGFVGRRRWRRPALLVLPTVMVFLPFVGGFRGVAAGTLAVWILGYALTGFYEEGLFRGLVLRILEAARPVAGGPGVRRAVRAVARDQRAVPQQRRPGRGADVRVVL